MVAQGWLIPGFTYFRSGRTWGGRPGVKTDLATEEPFGAVDGILAATAFGAGVWVAAAGRGSGTPVTDLSWSLDGNSWHAASGSPFGGFGANAVVWTGQRFIALGQNEDSTALVAVSSDGRSWSGVSTPTDGASVVIGDGDAPEAPILWGLAGSGDTWLATGPSRRPWPYDSKVCPTVVSQDGGLTWSKPDFAVVNSEFMPEDAGGHETLGVDFAAYGAGGFMGINAWGGASHLMQSSDGVTWEVIGTYNTSQCADGGYDPMVISENIVGFELVAARTSGLWIIVTNHLSAPPWNLFSSTDFGASWVGPRTGYNFLNVSLSNDVLFAMTEVPIEALYYAETGGGSFGDWVELDRGLFLTSGSGPNSVGYGSFIRELTGARLDKSVVIPRSRIYAAGSAP